MLTLPPAQTHSAGAASARDPARPGPAFVAPRAERLPGGQTERGPVALGLQPPERSGYAPLAGSQRRRHINGWDSSLLISDVCSVASGLRVRAPRSLHPQRQQRSETPPTRSGHLLRQASDFSATPTETIFWPSIAPRRPAQMSTSRSEASKIRSDEFHR